MEDRFHRALKAKIDNLKATRAAYMLVGSCQTYEAYRAEVSYIQALDDVLILCSDIEKEWNE